MTINENATVFDGRRVEDFDAAAGIRDATGIVYRLRVDYETAETFLKKAKPPAAKQGFFSRLFSKQDSGISEVPSAPQGSAFDELFSAFLACPASKAVNTLVIGDWGQAGTGTSSVGVVAALVKAKNALPSLRALFLGDITTEESEISWIEQTDVSPLWAAYPLLETIRIRGGNKLSLGKLSLPKLKTLIIESGGLPGNVLAEVVAAECPELEHLELWLGTDNYGWSGTIAQMQPILEGRLFPKLKYLGLRDSEEADAVAKAAADAAVLSHLETLDLSLGTLTDEGATCFLQSQTVGRLKQLDLHHHFLSEAMMAKLGALPCKVNVDGRQKEDEYKGETYRYVAVSE